MTLPPLSRTQAIEKLQELRRDESLWRCRIYRVLVPLLMLAVIAFAWNDNVSGAVLFGGVGALFAFLWLAEASTARKIAHHVSWALADRGTDEH